jgi:hypothetical protein
MYRFFQIAALYTEKTADAVYSIAQRTNELSSTVEW